MSSVSVVIPVFNQAALTERCLESLLAHSTVARELVIVDNHSTDRTPEVLESFAQRFLSKGWRFETIRNSENVGFGRACNQGIRASQGEFFAVLNNDTWLMPGWDEVLLRRCRELRADMIGPYYDETPFDSKGTPLRALRFIRRNRGKARRDWVSILMFFPRRTLDHVGLFDERYFVTCEDADLRERMDQAGMKYFMVGDCAIWHHSKGTRDHEALPKDYELEGLRLFKEKWGFDPRERENTRLARLKRRWRKIRTKLGWL